MDKKKLLRGTLWKFFERVGVFGTQFVVQIILARLLSPSDYGALNIMMVFITISNVLIQTGFSTALVQRKDIEEVDYSSVLWVSLLFSILVYCVIFGLSGIIAKLYHSPELKWTLRVIALVLFPGAINSVQLAKVTKELDFKCIFYSNLSGAIASGIVGILMAMHGYGLWALVFQYLINVTVCCVVMRITVFIKIYYRIEIKRIKIFLSFGWKLILSGLLNTLSEQLNSMIIGYKYTTESLGYYSRGMQFPNYGISIIEGTMTGVLLPSIAKAQDDRKEAKNIMRHSMLFTSFLVFPLMGGLALCAREVVIILLTEKWLSCVPYLQIFCGVFALYPVHICNLQTLNALGRSDLFLKLELIKKSYSIALVILMIILYDSPLAVAVCTLLISPIGWYVNALPNKNLICYDSFQQAKDLFPIFLSTVFMMLIVYVFSFLDLSPLLMLAYKIVIGIFSYIIISIVTRNEQFILAQKLIHGLFSRRKEV